LIGFVVSVGCGVMVGLVLTTPYFMVLNYLATDGPYFPPFLLALVFALFLQLFWIPLQLMIAVIYLFTGKITRRMLFLAILLGWMMNIGTYLLWIPTSGLNGFAIAVFILCQGIATGGSYYGFLRFF